MNEKIREMVMERMNAGRIAAAARADGELTLLREAGFTKVRDGVTTIAEVIRATKA
jgi:type II secretory ATPase GspE/PulE/Tfp pilus assembly ATPase PilB-like protein